MPKLNIDLTVTDQGSAVIKTFGNNVLQMATGFTAGQLAITAITEAARLFKEELFGGLRAVEDYNLSIATMTSFITTFSQKTAEGDLAGGFKEANEYAQQLIPTLEIMDAKTIATGRELTIMAETMAMNGVLLDVNNQKQQAGFLAIATSLKMITAGQNQDIQMRQEINALLQGQIRATDRLPKLLEAIDPLLSDHLKMWKEEGTLVENVGELLKGVTISGDLITQTWSAIGSSMETIHTRILRGGMIPAYEDLLQLAEDINRAFMDQDGNLTEMGKTTQGAIAVGWLDIKNTLSLINDLGVSQTFEKVLFITGKILDGWGMILAAIKPVADTVGNIFMTAYETASAMVDLANFEPEKAVAHWEERGRLMAEVYSKAMNGHMAEINNSLLEYDAAKNIGNKQTGKGAAPEMAAKKAADEVLKVEQNLTDQINKLTMDKYAYKKWALDQEIIDLQFKANSEQAWEQVAQLAALKNLELLQEQTKATAEADKKLLGEKLTEYQKVYAEIGKQIKDNFESEKAAIQAITDLKKQQLNIKTSTAGLLNDLSGKAAGTVPAAAQYKLSKSDLDQQLQMAKQLTGQDQIAALEKLKTAYHALALEFKDGFAGTQFASGKSGAGVFAENSAAIQVAYEQQKLAMDNLTVAAEKQAEASRIWGASLADSAVEANNNIVWLQETIDGLDAQLAAMDTVVAVAAQDDATRVIDQIQRELAALHDKTITITTRHVSVGGGSATPVLDSHALGTGYIPKTGPYELHYGESVNTAAETRALSAGGGAFKLAAGGGNTTFGDINIHIPANAAPQRAEDYRRITRDYIIPQLKEAGYGR